ncbi:MAG: DNA-binding protein WhiA [Synergistaceae bacterium]|jgi:hypothetical protein|nr:DNA-binding protein WhiA [Synergistaceae bacterium]
MEKISTVLWDEFLGLPTADAAEELSGFLETLPVSHEDGSAVMCIKKLVAARRVVKLWKDLNRGEFDGKMSCDGGSLELDKSRGRVLFRIPARMYSELVRAGRSEAVAGSRPTLVRWAWFRGAWGGSGAIYLPQSGYYMTLRAANRGNLGGRIRRVLGSAGIAPKARAGRSGDEYTIRDQEKIVTCLSKMGLVRTSLLLEETAIMRSLRDRANKMVNCDSANIGKSLSAARAQMALVETLDARGLWDRLTPALAELAVARRENPSASLGELGQILSKPVSKSTVEYRWRRLEFLITGDNYRQCEGDDCHVPWKGRRKHLR